MSNHQNVKELNHFDNDQCSDGNLYVSHDPMPSTFDFDLYPGDLMGMTSRVTSPTASATSPNLTPSTCGPPTPCPGRHTTGSSSNDSGVC